MDRHGTLWVTDHERLSFLRKGARRFEQTNQSVAGKAVFAQAPDGTLWISDEHRGTRSLPALEEMLAPARHPDDVPAQQRVESKRILFDREGGLWATDAVLGGVYRVASPEQLTAAADGTRILHRVQIRETFGQKDGLTADIAVPLLEDREGNIWVGTNLGLNRFRRSHAVVETTIPATAPYGYAFAAGNAGSLWIVGPRRVAAGTRRIDSACAGITAARGFPGPGAGHDTMVGQRRVPLAFQGRPASGCGSALAGDAGPYCGRLPSTPPARRGSRSTAVGSFASKQGAGRAITTA